MADQRAEDERATREATDALPTGYCILWDRDEHGQFCGDLFAPNRRMPLCGLAGERERVLRVLSASAHEDAQLFPER